MRPYNINNVVYTPGQVPDDPKALPDFLRREFSAIKAAIDNLSAGHIDTTYVSPAKPRTGDIRLADGIQWNPGAGAGFYGYYGGAWVKLG